MGKDTDMSTRMSLVSIFVVRFTLAIALLSVVASANSPQSNEPQPSGTPRAETPAPNQERTTPETHEEDSEETQPDDSKKLARHSDAERMGEIIESLEHDQKQLLALEQEMNNPDSEYAIAEKEFRSAKEEMEYCDEKLEAARKAIDASAVEHLEKEHSSLQRLRKLAEDRLDLAIEDRKTLREQKVTLKRKIENDKSALAAITGENREANSQHDDSAKEDPESEHSAHRDSQREPEQRNTPSNGTAHGDERDSHKQSHSTSKQSHSNSKKSDEAESDDDGDDQNPELVKAIEEAEEKEKEADEAQEETRSIAARLADIQKLVVQEQKELTLARKKVDLSSAAQLTLSQELTRRTAEGADVSELAELRTSIANASNRLIQARSEVAEISERLNDHRAEQSTLQSEHIVALHEAEKKRQEANEAEGRTAAIRNPFTLHNISKWIVEHGPPILAIVAGMFIFNWLASFFASRSVHLVTTSSGRGSKTERENRAKTLVGVFQNASTVGIFIAGVMMVLDEAGANITVLMGGVAVIGLAVAFGAQNLIKDYFYGFVMLLENQYMLNDFVRVGGVSGQVERITLRMTVLRDSNGVVHFIPNGTINSVSNETHGWSRAVCDIAVGHQESLDRITDILNSISQELHRDPTFGSLLLELPSSPAIENLGESAMNLKMSVKTLPNKHGAVKQEWLKRIKNRFGELGIQHPYPQRSVYVQSIDDGSARENNPTYRTGGFRQAG
jgi:moderate conductance mechanosensitive channel